MTWNTWGFVGGLVLLVVGVGLLSVPAGLIVAGVALAAVSLLVEVDE